MRLLRLHAGLILSSLAPLFAATAVWTGEMGDGDWLNQGNWSDRVLPGPNDDVLIQVRSRVVIDDSVTVRSLTIRGESELNVIGPETVLTVTGPSLFEGASFVAADGGKARLQGPSSISALSATNNEVLWSSTDGGLITVSWLTNLVGSSGRVLTTFYPRSGGKIVLDGNFTFETGSIRFGATGGGVTELPGLRRLRPRMSFAMDAGEGSSIVATNLLEIDASNYTEYLSLASRGSNSVLHLAGLTNLFGTLDPLTSLAIEARDGGKTILDGSFHVTGGRVILVAAGPGSAFDASGLRSIRAEAIWLTVDDGASFRAPRLARWDAGVIEDQAAVWESSGAGSLLEIGGLTNLAGAPFPFVARIQAQNGATVRLNGDFDLSSGAFALVSRGPASRLEANGLRRIVASQLNIEAAGGELFLPDLEDVRPALPQFGNLLISADSGGSLVWHNLRRFEGSAGIWQSLLYSQSAAVYIDGAAEVTGGSVALFSENGSLVLPAFQRINATSFELDARGPGRVLLTNLFELSAAAALNGYRFQASGAESLVEIWKLTNLVGAPYPRYVVFYASEGAKIEFDSVIENVSGGVALAAEDPATSIALKGLNRFAASHSEITAGNGARIQIDSLPLWDGAAGTRATHYWTSRGTNSLLQIDGLRQLQGSPYPFDSFFQALDAGAVRLGGNFEIPGGSVSLLARDPGSRLDLPGLNSARPTAWAAGALDGAAIDFPELTRFSAVNTIRDLHSWISEGSNSTLTARKIGEFNIAGAAARFVGQDGGRLELDGNFALEGGRIGLYSVGGNSVIHFPGLRKLAPRTGQFHVSGGARLLFPALTNYSPFAGEPWQSGNWQNWEITGSGTLLEAPALRAIAIPEPYVSMWFNVMSGAVVRLPILSSIVGGAFSLEASGTGTFVDLRSLSNIATSPYGPGFSVASEVTLMLPPVFSFSGITLANLSAWGAPISYFGSDKTGIAALVGRAARVEIRPSGDPNAPWETFRRIPVSTNLMILHDLYDIPPGVELRVSELQTTRPEIDLYKATSGKVLLTVFSANTRAYRLQSSPTVNGAIWTDEATIQASNPFTQTELTAPITTRFLRLQE